MNTFQLTCFLTVAETLNFARASQRLHITQPAVTHQIRALETELDVKLFLRTTHFVELTHAGRLFIEDAKTIVMTSLRAKKRFEKLEEHELAMLGIGCHIDGYLQILPKILQEFSLLYPETHPYIFMVPSQQFLFKLLEDEKADIVFGNKERTPSKYNGIYKELVKSRIACICSAMHPFAGRSRVSCEDLKNERLILFDTTKSSFFDSQLQGRLMGERSITDVYFCESTITALMLAKAAYGVFCLPEVLAPADDALVSIPMEDVERQSFGMYYKTLRANTLLKDFVRLVKAHFDEA